MAEGNQRVADSLKEGREAFEAGDLAAAREAFLQVSRSTRRDADGAAYLDRIEEELAAPSAGPTSRAEPPQRDILEEEMADAASAPAEPAAAAAKRRGGRGRRAPRSQAVPRLIGAVFVAARRRRRVARRCGSRSRRRARAAAGGRPEPAGRSLENATGSFREGKIPETMAELKRISPERTPTTRRRSSCSRR